MTTPPMTQPQNVERVRQHDRRQSLRVPLSVPLIVADATSPETSEYCETVEANAHGCQLRSPRPLETGMEVRLATVYAKNRTVNAIVIHSEPLGLQETRRWNCGLALSRPGNFWGIPSPPQDWPAADYPGGNGLAPIPRPLSEPRPATGHAGSPHGLIRSPQDWQQMLSKVDERIAALEAHLEKTANEFEATALTRLQRSIAEMIGEARERFDRDVDAGKVSHLTGLETDLEQRLARILNRGQAAISALEQRLEAMRQEHEAWERRTGQQQRPQDRAYHQAARDLAL